MLLNHPGLEGIINAHKITKILKVLWWIIDNHNIKNIFFKETKQTFKFGGIIIIYSEKICIHTFGKSMDVAVHL